LIHVPAACIGWTPREEVSFEIPTVKVLDPADLPEKKTFPPRLLIGASTCSWHSWEASFSCLLIKGWNEKDPHDLSKAIVTEIWIDLKQKNAS
jgi:hypothetical protein